MIISLTVFTAITMIKLPKTKLKRTKLLGQVFDQFEVLSLSFLVEVWQKLKMIFMKMQNAQLLSPPLTTRPVANLINPLRS